MQHAKPPKARLPFLSSASNKRRNAGIPWCVSIHKNCPQLHVTRNCCAGGISIGYIPAGVQTAESDL